MNECFAEKNSSMIENRSFKSGFVNHAAAVFFAVSAKIQKSPMTQDEIAVMDGGKCILQLRGVRPFFSDKFDITKHPNYKYLSDADKKNTFDMEKHLRRRPAIVKPNEVFDYYEIDAASLDGDADHE